MPANAANKRAHEFMTGSKQVVGGDGDDCGEIPRGELLWICYFAATTLRGGDCIGGGVWYFLVGSL